MAGVALALSGLLKNIFMVWVSVFVLNYLYESLVGIVCKNGAATYYPLTYAHQVAPLGRDGIIGYGDVNDPVIGNHNNWDVLGSKEA